MNVIVGSDHAGFELKQIVAQHLRDLGQDVSDVGTDSTNPVDYPDFAAKVAHAVLGSVGSRGVLICGSGVGASVAANKVKGVRAGLCHDTYSAHQGVEHDDMNILVLGARVIGTELAKELVRSFLGASFSREERHMRRVGKIIALEANL
ncbi:MAG: ribose 5-phosphate isomerase B [Acidobacteriaceae bacterium]